MVRASLVVLGVAVFVAFLLRNDAGIIGLGVGGESVMDDEDRHP